MERLFIGPGGEVDDRGELGLFVQSKLGRPGCVVYGPYHKHPPGEYEVSFDIDTDGSFIDTDGSFVNDGRDIGTIDVVADFGRQIIRTLPSNSSTLVAGGGTRSFKLGITSADRRCSNLEY